MTVPKILKANPPVLCRWLKRRRYFPLAVLLACIMIFLPLGVIGGVKLSRIIMASKAMAATRAMAPEHAVLDVMSESERAQFASVLSGLLMKDPQTVYRLIGQDFLVMFDEPDLRRQEGSTSIWQYRTASCVLDLYFQEEEGQAGMVTHFEIRNRQMALFGSEEQTGIQIDDITCLKDIYEERSI